MSNKNALTHTEMNTWGKCPMMHYYEFRAGQQQNGIESTAPYMPFIEGRFMHHTLEIFCRTGQMQKANLFKWGDAAFAKYCKNEEISVQIQKRLYMCYGAALGYRQQYPNEPNKRWVGLEVPFEFEFQGFRFAGKVDGYYEAEDGLVLVEHKFVAPRAVDTLIGLPLNAQRWMYVMGVHSLAGRYPVRVEHDFIFKSALRLRESKQESEDEYAERVKEQYIKESKKMFAREQTLVESTYVEGIFQKLIMPRAQVMAGRVPWLNDTQCAPFAGRPCEFMPACEELLKGRQGWEAPRCAGLYVEKKHRHPELEEE